MRRLKPLRADDNALFAGGHFERVVLHVLTGPAEDRVQQLLFGGQFRLRLRRDLADEDVAGADPRADADDAELVEVGQRAFRHVRDVARELLTTRAWFHGFRRRIPRCGSR
jgi:hypothetical protein